MKKKKKANQIPQAIEDYAKEFAEEIQEDISDSEDYCVKCNTKLPIIQTVLLPEGRVCLGCTLDKLINLMKQ